MFRALEPVADLSALTGLEARLDMPGMMDRLTQGHAGAYLIAGVNAAIVMSVGVSKDTHARALWIEALGGEVGFVPHRNRRLIAAVIEDAADIGRLSQCTEIRIEANTRSALKRRLFRSFGFDAVTFGTATYMRKGL